jgi:hypothetical protein
MLTIKTSRVCLLLFSIRLESQVRPSHRPLPREETPFVSSLRSVINLVVLTLVSSGPNQAKNHFSSFFVCTTSQSLWRFRLNLRCVLGARIVITLLQCLQLLRLKAHSSVIETIWVHGQVHYRFLFTFFGDVVIMSLISRNQSPDYGDCYDGSMRSHCTPSWVFCADERSLWFRTWLHD